MNTLAKSLIAFMFFSVNVFSQWELLTPKLTTFEITKVISLSPKRYLFCTEGGEVFLSENAGKDWKKVYDNPSIHFGSMYFINDKKGWAYNKEYIDTLKFIITTDGGSSWDSFSVHKNYGAVTELQFVSDSVGFMCLTDTVTALFKTIDGGV
jgi:photosystem II stability/assembly factor-like uncharacterized protein